MRKRYLEEELFNICPVCGYDNLIEPPFDKYGYPSHEICPCCGFEFGFDDTNKGYTYTEYREEWIHKGYNWFSTERKIPHWNKEVLMQQLRNIEKVKHYVPHFIMDKHKAKLKG